MSGQCMSPQSLMSVGQLPLAPGGQGVTDTKRGSLSMDRSKLAPRNKATLFMSYTPSGYTWLKAHKALCKTSLSRKRFRER